MRNRWALQARQRNEAAHDEFEVGSMLGSSSFVGNDGIEDATQSSREGSHFDDGWSHVDEVIDTFEVPDPKKAKVEFRFALNDEPSENVQSCASDPLDAAMGSSLIRDTDTKQFRYPWEKGYLGRFFNAGTLPGLEPPRVAPGNRNLVGLVVEADEEKIKPLAFKYKPKLAAASVVEKVVKKADTMAFVEEKRTKRDEIVFAWWELLCDNMDCSAVGRKVSVEALFDDLQGYACSVVDASFAVKSVNTLQKRLGALKAYKCWCADRGKLSWLPLKERDAWEYVSWLSRTEAAPTKASSFVEACRFGWYVLGISGCNEVEQSLRVRGLTSQLHCKKRPWRPADTLSLGEVAKIHEFLADASKPLADRAVCGHLLHLLYSRSRWSDMVNVRNLFIDSDKQYIEVDGCSHKGSRSAQTKTKLLPIVGPCVGAVDQPWALLYMDVRRQCNLDDPEQVGRPMLPAPMDAEGCSWGQRYMTSSEGSAFMREILGVQKAGERRISSHSLKSTAISWCSKFGLNEDAKALLARHASSIRNPQALYSRDLLSPVLRSFDQVLGAIRAGAFMPDRTRSGMVVLSGEKWQQYGLQPPTVGVPATPVYNADLRAPMTPAQAVHNDLQTSEPEPCLKDVKQEDVFVAGDLIEVNSSPELMDEDDALQPAPVDGGMSESSEFVRGVLQ